VGSLFLVGIGIIIRRPSLSWFVFSRWLKCGGEILCRAAAQLTCEPQQKTTPLSSEQIFEISPQIGVFKP
jgi:hypothetical protein